MSKNLISRYLPRTLFHSVCLLVVLSFLAFNTILIDGFYASCLKQNNRNIDHEYDWNEISELIREFLTKNDGRFPRSFTEISEEADEKFGGNYAFLTDYSSSKRSVNRACVIERIPLRSVFPFPFGVFATSYSYGDSLNSDNPTYLSDWSSRKACDWASRQDSTTRQKIPRFDLRSSFLYDAVIYLLVVGMLILFVYRSFYVRRREDVCLKYLEKIYEELVNFRLKNKRFPDSENEFVSETFLGDYGAETKERFQYLGDLSLTFEERRVVYATKKAWRAPFFPFWGGKRAYILLEDGEVVKLKSVSTVEDFFERVKIADANDARRISSENNENSIYDFLHNSFQKTKEPGLLNSDELKSCLQMKNKGVIRRTVETVLSSIFFGVSLLGVGTLFCLKLVAIPFSAFGIITADPFFVAPFVILNLFYWILVSIYYAEYHHESCRRPCVK